VVCGHGVGHDSPHDAGGDFLGVRAALRLENLVVVTETGVRYRLTGEVPPGGRAAVVCAAPGVGPAVARTIVGLRALGKDPNQSTDPLIAVGQVPMTTKPPGRRNVGYVPPGGALLPHLDVHDNLWFDLRQQGDTGRQARERVERLTDTLRLGHTLHVLPHELDDRQRLAAALARAVACRPRALVVELAWEKPELERLESVLEDARQATDAAATMSVLVCAEAIGVKSRDSRREGWPGIACVPLQTGGGRGSEGEAG
jgi:ABC-type thiamine transport system ATPase subunit